MNIEKIKNYNQKLLAVLGTILVLIGIVALVMFSYFAIVEIRRDFRYTRQESGILSGEKAEELRKRNLRKQLISFEMPVLVDTLNAVYMIPVSHKSLEDPEYIGTGLLNLLDSYGEVHYDRRYSSEYYGSFNNLLVYDSRNDDVNELFTERVNFRSITTEYFGDDILFIIKAANEDTNGDGVINMADHKSLYVYSLRKKDLRVIEVEGADIADYQIVNGTKDILVLVGTDKDQDGAFDKYREPAIIKKYDYNSGTLIDIVDENMRFSLQDKLDGAE